MSLLISLWVEAATRRFRAGLTCLSVAVLTFCFLGCAPAGDAPLGEEFVSHRETMVVHLVSDAQAYAAKSRNIEALFNLERARFLTPNNPKIEANLALIYENLELYEDALALVEKLLPPGRVLFEKQRLNVKPTATPTPSVTPIIPIGTATLNSLVQDTSYPKLLIQRARILFQQGRKAEARRGFDEAYRAALDLQQTPVAQAALRSAGALEFGLGIEDEADCLAQQELATLPTADTLASAARMLLARGRLERLQAVLTAQIAGSQTDPNFWVMFAHLWYGLRKYDDVIASLERAVTVAGPTASLPNEVHYLRYLAAKAKSDAGKPLVSEDLLENYQEAFETELTGGESPSTLFWSVPLALDVRAQRESLEGE